MKAKIFTLTLAFAVVLISTGTSQKIYDISAPAASTGVLSPDFSTKNTPGWNLVANSDIPVTSYLCGSAAHNGKLYVIGGNTAGGANNQVSIYDVETNTWTTGANLPGISVIGNSITVGDFIYHQRASNGTVATTDFYKYDIVANSWSSMAALPQAMTWSTLVSSGENLYLVGGRDNADPTNPVNWAYRYNVATNTWSTATALPEVAWAGAATFLNGKIYYFSGIGATTFTSNVYVGEINTDNPDVITWSTLTNFSGTPVYKFRALPISSTEIIFTGGNSGAGELYWTGIPDTYLFNTVDNSFTLIENKGVKTNAYAAGVIMTTKGESKFVVAGGIDSGGDGPGILTPVEYYLKQTGDVVSATINPTEVTIDYDDEEAAISTIITWNDASEVIEVLVSSPDFSELEGELEEDQFSIVDNGDGTATFTMYPNQEKGFFSKLDKFTMVIHFTFVFDVGNDAVLVINIDNWKWFADIEVRNKTTGNPIAGAAVYVHELDETFFTGEWGWTPVEGLEVGPYTLTITANGYISLQNQVIDVEAGFDNEFLFELDPAFNTYFHYGVVDGTRPDWFSDGDHTERGLTADQDNVYVVSRKGGLQVLVIDRTNGLETGVLNVNGITGGYWVLNDIEISADGHLVGFNMFLSGGQFKAYLLDETNDPEVLFTTDIIEGRYGDKVTMVGSFDDGSAVIYAANGSAPVVLKWTMVQSGGKDGWVFNPDPQVITLSDVTAAGTPAIAPLPNGSFYWTANGRSVTKHNADGTLIGTISGGILATGTNAMKYLGRIGNDEILAVFAYGANNEIAKVVRVLNGNPENTELIFNTPTLRGGSATSNPNGTGDVAFLPYPDGNVALYVLGTNIGIGGYASIYFDLAFPVYPPADLVSATINPTEATIDMDTGGIITTVITWNDASELTKVLITFPDFPELEAQEITDDAYTLVDNGDGTATFSFDTDQPKGVSDWFGKYTLSALMTFIFNVGDDAVLNLTIENWTWWAEIEVTDKVTGNPIQNAAVHIQELDETHHTDQWGWADIDLDAGTYTLNISATGYVALPNQVIEVEANFENKFHFELEPEGSNIDETELAGIAIFPNPATTLLNISSENPIMEISLTNMLGQVIYLMEQAGNSHSINISSFNKGMYFVRIATENGVLVRKVLIRK